MNWIVRVDPMYSRVPWNEQVFKREKDLKNMLRYLRIDHYIGPGVYTDPSGYIVEVLYG